MPTMLVGYDLNKDKEYTDLIDAIKTLGGAWWHHLDSTWLVKTTLTPKQVRDRLRSYLDNDDELLVIDVTRRSRAWAGFSARGSEWLRTTFE